jgi:hypothetical protein
MLDVFNVDSAVPEVSSFKSQYSPDNINVYWNRSVTTTRDFHADTYSGQFKSFVYLTDVPDRSHGSFSYVKGSHRSSKTKRKVSKLANKVKGTHLLTLSSTTKTT